MNKVILLVDYLLMIVSNRRSDCNLKNFILNVLRILDFFQFKASLGETILEAVVSPIFVWCLSIIFFSTRKLANIALSKNNRYVIEKARNLLLLTELSISGCSLITKRHHNPSLLNWREVKNQARISDFISLLS